MTCLDDALVLGFVEGRLPPATLAGVDDHIDACASCRDLVTLVAGARTAGRVLSPGDKLGRFVIGALRGTGAMGRVYAAFEPELDRHVAIKVLIEDGRDARARLVREAQAMARLNHPNVVTVHEVGTTDAGVFVAMELVEGDSLRAWVGEPRPWREVVGVLVEIARGLGAVHAAGVVHRDVKPDNMIVGADGRARLGDFGLARSGAALEGTALAAGTATTVAGTPAYMAPEILRGGAATAASDQFSYGVMAYELLAGRRPFTGATWSELLAHIERAEVGKLDTAPASVNAIVRRCLAVEPGQRAASMQAVAAALAATIERRRPGAWIAAGLAAAVVASSATWWAVSERRVPDPRPSVRANACAIAALGDGELGSSTGGTFPGAAAAALARWSSAFEAERATACASPEPRRDRCLAQRRLEFQALVVALAEAPATAPHARLSIAPPSECRLASRDEGLPLPLDPARAAATREVLAEIAGVRASIALGQRVSATTGALVTRARALDHAPTLGEALLAHTEALRSEDLLVEAVASAREATAAATRGHADLLAARAWLARVAIAGSRRDLDSAEDVGALAEAAVERIGSPPHMVVTLRRLRGLIAYNRGELARARELLLAAHAAPPDELGPADRASVRSALGSVERQAGNLDDAERWHRSALALDLELHGEPHRDVARDHHNIAGVLRLRGRLDDALVAYHTALAIEIATQGERSVAAGLTHNSIGLVLLATRDYARAASELARARDILTAAGHGDRAFATHNLGLLAQAQGKHRAALQRFDEAAAIYATTIGEGAAAARRLPADRAASVAALRPAKRPAPKPVAPPKPRDVGVYGSGQTW